MSTMIFFIGIFLIAASLIGTAIAFFLLQSYKKHLKIELDKEYGAIQK